MTKASQTRPLPQLGQVLFNRTRRVKVPQPKDGARTGQAFKQLEMALQMNGLVMERPLYEAVQALSDAQLESLFNNILPRTLKEYGASAYHRALFRNFPEQTPQDTYEFYLRRLLAFTLKDPRQPCALDGDNRPFGLSFLPSRTPRHASTACSTLPSSVAAPCAGAWSPT